VKLEQIYELAVQTGIKKDPRGKVEIERLLAEAGKEFEKLKGDDRKFFDRQRLANPTATPGST
jgi:hypothetical protein